MDRHPLSPAHLRVAKSVRIERRGAMALRVGQVGARESHVDARARDVEAQITDEERFWGRMRSRVQDRPVRKLCSGIADLPAAGRSAGTREV